MDDISIVLHILFLNTAGIHTHCCSVQAVDVFYVVSFVCIVRGGAAVLSVVVEPLFHRRLIEDIRHCRQQEMVTHHPVSHHRGSHVELSRL